MVLAQGLGGGDGSCGGELQRARNSESQSYETRARVINNYLLILIKMEAETSDIAQLGERQTEDLEVTSSILVVGKKKKKIRGKRRTGPAFPLSF